MKFFTRRASDALRTKAGGKHWDKLWRDYEAHLRSIQASLSADWLQIADGDFHDAKILSVRRPSKREAELGLDSATLVFRGVSLAWIPESVIGDIWLYHEVHLADDGSVDLQVLLNRDEIRVTSQEIEIIRRTQPNKITGANRGQL